MDKTSQNQYNKPQIMPVGKCLRYFCERVNGVKELGRAKADPGTIKEHPQNHPLLQESMNTFGLNVVIITERETGNKLSKQN